MVARIKRRQSISRLRAAGHPVFFRQQLSGYLGIVVPVDNDIRHVATAWTVVNIVGLIDSVRRALAVGGIGCTPNSPINLFT